GSTAGIYARGLILDSAQFTLNNGNSNFAGNRKETKVTGSSGRLTVNGGTLTVGPYLYIENGGTLIINGGTLKGSHLNVRSGGIFKLNGGTITADDFISNAAYTTTFGGTAKGSLTLLSGLGTVSTLDWLTGTRMSMTVASSNEWAEALWNSGHLKYNGQDQPDLGKTWAQVTAPDGLGSGCRFAYDSTTETLSLVSGVALSGYDVWAAGWSNNIGVAANDFDGDGLNNLYEYGMGGNPTNALDRGTLPTFTRYGSRFLYIYPQRSDDGSLIYTVETTTNLLDSGSWTHIGTTVIGTNVTGGEISFVTNDVDTVESEKYIRLKIGQQ
ncbi:MAG TPA: hypothetical protein VJ904_04405, partial [Tichowtungia sp.]|nr:hypothetical protein [Tichowtungia sp.]